MRRRFVGLALGCVLLLPLTAAAQDVQGFEARTLKGSRGLTLPYRLFKVKNPEASKKYPLILFLHGAGERGDNNTSQLTANQGATVWASDAHQAEHPAYVIAPQCPTDKQWVDTDWTKGSYSITNVPLSDQLATALEIADAIADEFDTDPTRQYITGLSMGGYGTWDAVLRNPTRFAAALPVCGAGDPTKAEAIKSLPLWTAHGDADTVVPVSGSREMVMALETLGSDIQYSEYPGVGHDAWTQTYANEEIIDWLFENQQAPSSEGGGGAGGMAAGGSGGASSGGGGASSGGKSAGGAATAGAPTSSGGSGGQSSGQAGAATAGASTTPPETSHDDGGCSYTRGPAEPTWLGALLAVASLGRISWRSSKRRKLERSIPARRAA